MTTRPNFKEYKAKVDNMNNTKAAAIRCLPMWCFHALFPPITSVVYCSKMNYWKPAIVATAVAGVTFAFDVASGAIVSMIIPPATSAAKITSKVQKSRRDLGIIMPEEADERLYNLGL